MCASLLISVIGSLRSVVLFYFTHEIWKFILGQGDGDSRISSLFQEYLQYKRKNHCFLSQKLALVELT